MKIRIATDQDLESIFQIYSKARKYLDNQGIFQWYDGYPSRKLAAYDIANNDVYVLEIENRVVATVCLNETQDEEYKSIPWEYDGTKVLVIHRLAVLPEEQGKGIARKIMDFSENYATENNYTSIRLDAYSENNRVLKMYDKRGYTICGEIYFHARDLPFYCLEKRVDVEI